MNYQFYLALKYLKPQKDKFFSYTSLLISILGIAIGVCTLVVTLGIMTGFHKEIRARLATIYPHIIITSNYSLDDNVLKSNNMITAYSEFIYGQAIIKFNDKVNTVIVKGIKYEKEKNVTNIKKIINWINDKEMFDKNSVLLGKELAKSLGVSLNDEIVMVLPTQIVTPFGNLPLTQKFVVKGILSSGVYEYDSSLCIIDYDIAKELFYDKIIGQFNAVHGWGVKLKNDNYLELVTNELRSKFGPFSRVLSWIELNYNLFSALKLEKVMMIIIVSLIILVACFIIMSNLLLKGVQKSKDIGILMAMGLQRKAVKTIFFIQGMVINLTGVVLGLIAGIILGLLIKQYQFVKLPKEVYYIDRIPVYFSLPDILIVLLITITVGIFASIYPAHKISQFDPVEIIRYG
ncbi:MAG: ABC transporter permease [Endomicrobia bacterium]|nr:ABC transporter permease [Endomicrobiia bacterium]MDW8055613.1 ABC transporter permease [Elusimicrobiota bacterium]